MASNFIAFNPIGIRASSAGADITRRSKSSFAPNYASSSPDSASNWWSPLFGWSSDPDYMDENQDRREPNPARYKISPGGFTEEKARRLRMMTTGSETFHDVMYHSAIASRLASDFSRRSDR